MKQTYPKAGLYLAVQPILAENIHPLRDLSDEVAAMLSPCPENEEYLAVLNGTSRTETRRQRLTALHCLLTLMREAAPDLVATLRLHRDDKGRPYGERQAADAPAFDFNLTHTDTHAACALLLGGGRVGVDAEALIPAEKAKKISTRFFTAAEQAYLQTVPQDRYAHEVTRLWTVKEARSKQDGRGFPLSFDGLAIEPSLRLHHYTMILRDKSPLFLTLCAPDDAGIPTVVQLPEGSWLDTYQA